MGDFIRDLMDSAMNRHPEIKGYKLLQKYPGCNKEVGDFEPYTTGDFSNYPNIWEPVYHKHIDRENKINQLLNDNGGEI